MSRTEKGMGHWWWRRIGIRWTRVGAVAMLLLGVTALYIASVPVGASGSGGTATPTGQSATPITGSQASTQLFSLTLSGGAGNGLDGAADSCAGDSATGSTTFWSYMLPQNTSPATVTVSGGALSAGNGLFTNGGTPDGGNHNVGVGTGQVPAVSYSFAKTKVHVTGGLIPTGHTSAVFEIGILCWNGSSKQVTDWWNAEATFTSSTTDTNGFTWVVVPGPATGDGGSSTTSSSTSSTSSSTSSSTTSSSTTSTTSSTTTSTTLASTTTTPCVTTTTSPTSSSSTTSTSTSSTTSTTVSTTSTVACATTATSGTASSGAVAAGASGTDGATGSALPFTGRNTTLLLAMGMTAIVVGLMLLAAARQRQELERLSWPDEG